MTIDAALSDERPDIQVSQWLQDKVWGPGDAEIPAEVMATFRVDHYLMEVNMGGHLTYFQNAFDEMRPTMRALDAIGLETIHKALASAAYIVFGADLPVGRDMVETRCAEVLANEERSSFIDQLDQAVMRSSKSIERATHEYIRRNLDTFKRLDG